MTAAQSKPLGPARHPWPAVHLWSLTGEGKTAAEKQGQKRQEEKAMFYHYNAEADCA